MDNNLMFSSAYQAWATRWETFHSIQEQLGRSYNLDPCSNVETAKCDNFITEEDDLFKYSFNELRSKVGGVPIQMFVNPEYGRKQYKFVEYMCFNLGNPSVICDVLIPSRTDTKLFHDLIIPFATTIRFIKGRITFGSDSYWEWVWEQEFINGKKNSLYKKYGKMNAAPFPSMIVSFGEDKEQTIETITLAKNKYEGKFK